MRRHREAFEIVAVTPPGLADPSLAIAASRAGEIGILDLHYVPDDAARVALGRLAQYGRSQLGVKLRASDASRLDAMAGGAGELLAVVIVTPGDLDDLPRQLDSVRREGRRILLECVSLEEALVGERLGLDGIVAKGHEAAGRVGHETTFVLLQQLLSRIERPVWAQGGIGLHTAAAVWAAGAAGVVLDSQLYLTSESPLPAAVRARIAAMDGSETVCLGQDLRPGEGYRVFMRPGMRAVAELEARQREIVEGSDPPAATVEQWRRSVEERVGWGSPDTDVWFLGQDAALAAGLADRFGRVADVLREVRRAIDSHAASAAKLRPLDADSPLAESHGTRYPIAQGPMTRVSDTAAFAAAVAEAGALPFLALALMRGPDVRRLLEDTRHRLGDRPWGVGILGFVPMNFREEQLTAIRACPPPFALIAGGRPDQARALEAQGIATYLHVPSPALLKLFIADGARRFVFEGRECGGHVGPRSSFVLWESMIEVLLAAVPQERAKAQEYHVLFAGGVHDALSASMVAAMAAPLAERGVRLGVLMGTAYIFTEEAVAAGAIVGAFQDEALRCERTTLLETGPGHLTRCVETAYVEQFREERRRLLQEGRSHDEIRLALEDLNLGRLRMASKGIARREGDGERSPFIALSEDEQRASGMYMIGQVAALRDRIVSLRDLHHDVAVEGARRLDAAIAEPQPHAAEPGRSRRDRPPADIAIIGMAGLFPKAPDLRTFWRNIVNRVDVITEIPPDRWDWRLYFDPDPQAKDKVYSKWGGFIDDIPFEPTSYGMPPNSLASIEPLQLLTLEVVRAALKDAQYLDRAFDRERVSVVLGTGGAGDLGQDYVFRAGLSQFLGDDPALVGGLDRILPQWTEDSFPGILMNVTAGRVANRFDLGGPNYTVDAACASSLAATYLGVRELEAGASDMVVVGGADTIQSPFAYLCFSKTHALSPTGRCRTFDAKADGIVISEGVAVVVLKRLADAERDGDRIYAVIKAVAGASDGRDKGLTAPRPEGQMRTLRRAYARAGVSPATVGLFEAHGTGTVAGDRAELESLTGILNEAQAAPRSAAVGSVKSMIGHTKNTAGVAGLIKVALALHRKVLPATLGVETPNAKVAAPTSPVYVNTEVRPWLAPTTGTPRRGAVSAFGFGGTNFHAVLEEYRGDFLPDPAQLAIDQREAELFLWRASSRADIRTAVDALERALGQPGVTPGLTDLAFTVYRAHAAGTASASGGATLAVVASSLEDLRAKLGKARQYLDQPVERTTDPRGIYWCEGPLARAGKLAVLFPGQGSQHVDMLRDLAVNFVEVREQFERADRALDGALSQPLSAYIFPPPGGGESDAKARKEALTQTNIAQPAMGAAGLAAFRLAQALGIRPDFMAGHSYGEYVALCAAGVFSEDDLFVLSEARGRFMVEGASLDPGGMAAVEAGPNEVARCLAGLDGVVVANHNAPKQTIVSGTRPALEAAVRQLKSAGFGVRLIPVACAFHSPVVAPAQEKLGGLLSSMVLGSPSVPVFSNTTASPHESEPAVIARQLVEHTIAPVRFADEIEAMYLAGARVFLEVGPRNVLTGLVDQILGDRPHLAVALDQPGRPPIFQLLHALGRLAADGVPVTLERLFEGASASTLDLDRLPTAPVPGPTTWLVNGGYARPAKQPPRAPRVPAERSAAMPTSPVVTPAPTSNDPRRPPTEANGAGPGRDGRLMPSPSEVPTPRQAPTPSPAPVARGPVTPAPMAAPHGALPGSDIAQVMSQFQQLMQRFLETQQVVMLAYLRGRPDVSAPTIAASPPRMPAVAAPTRLPAAMQPAPEPRSAPERVLEEAVPRSSTPAPPAVVLDEATITARLLDIVGERTGYPADMLNLDLDLEGDLGIDSIKRIEILGTYQHQYLTPEETPGDEAMEKLTSIRTLRGIVAWMLASTAEANGAHPAAGAPTRPSARAAPAPSAVDEATLTAQLLEIVSERTGYPAEMLDLDQDLEADLGIDSIKRIEILGTYQQKYLARDQKPDDEAMEKLTSIRTLRGIVAWLMASAAAPKAATVGPSPSASLGASAAVPPGGRTEESGKPLHRYRISPTAVGGLEGVMPVPVAGVVIVTDDQTGIAESLTAQLAERRQAVALVRWGEETKRTEPGRFTSALASPADVTELVDLVRREHGPIGGLVHLLPLGPAPRAAEMDGGAWRERLRQDVKSLFHLAQALDADLKRAAQAGGACLIAATGMGGSFGLEAEEFFPGHGAVAGLAKTLSREWPAVRVKVVDLSPRTPVAQASGQLLDEIFAPADVVEVGYRDQRRLTVTVAPAPVDCESSPTFAIDRSSVILITGGARGITAEIARDLAERYQPTLILVGRSPSPPPEEAPDTVGLATPRELKEALVARTRRDGRGPNLAEVEAAYNHLIHEREVRITLNAIERAGARIQYVSADVRDGAALANLLDRVYEAHGRIDGVIHGAGVIEDKLVRDKTAASFDRVFDTKVDAAVTLSQTLRPDDLRFLVFFSSVAATFGNRGQADYAAANEVLNKLALQLDRSWPGRVVSVNWGPWASGMVSAELERQFAARGIELISPTAGRRALTEELCHGARGEAVIVLTAGGGEPLPGVEPPARRLATPMLEWSTAKRNGHGEVEFPVVLDPARDLYLADHKLSGKPVVPMAVACEMMAEAAALAAPELELVAIRDLKVLGGIVLENGIHPVRVATTPLVSTPTGAEIEVTIIACGESPRVHYRCVAELARGFAEPRPEALPVFGDAKPFPLSVDQAYRWLFHGPRLRGIRTVSGVSGEGIIGSIATSSPRDLLGRDGAAGWLVDPMIIDNAIQLMIFWLRLHRDVVALPSGFRSYRRFGPPSSSPVECRVQIWGDPTNPTVNANVAFVDEAGRVLGLVEELALTCSKALIPIFEYRTEA